METFSKDVFEFREARIDLINNQLVRISHRYKEFSTGNRTKKAASMTNKNIDSIQINQLSKEDTVVLEQLYGNSDSWLLICIVI